MMKYLDVIGLGHLNPKIEDNAIDGEFYFRCTQEDLKYIGIGGLQAKKFREYLPNHPRQRA